MKKLKVILLVVTMMFSSVVFAEEDSPSPWAEEFVERVHEQELLEESFFKGYHEPITRGEFAYLGVKLYEEYTGKTAVIGDATFTDTDNEWALKAKNVGIVGGYPDGSYKPENPIRRDELATLYHNIFKAAEVEYLEYTGQPFSDDRTIASWAKESVYVAKANDIVSGIGNNIFDATGQATKEQSLIMFSKGQTSENIISPVDRGVVKDTPADNNSNDSSNDTPVVVEPTQLEIGSTLLYKTKEEAYAFVEEHCGIFDASEYKYGDDVVYSISGDRLPLSVEVTNGIVSSISFGNSIRYNADGTSYIADYSDADVTVYGYSLNDSYSVNKAKMGSKGSESIESFGNESTGIIATNRLTYWINENAHFVMTYSADGAIHIGISIND